jgi:hypothetical protein
METFKMGNSESFRKKFKNIRRQECKLNSIPNIYAWVIEDRLVEMSELLAYSGLSLIYSYTMNMINSSKAVKDKSVAELMRLVGRMEREHKIKIL